MMKIGWNVFARFEPMYVGHSLHIINDTRDGRYFVKRIEMEQIDPHSSTIKLSEQPIPPDEVEDFLRACMDAAWELGIRPTGYEDHKNELTAVRYHLEDMRRLTILPTEQA